VIVIQNQATGRLLALAVVLAVAALSSAGQAAAATSQVDLARSERVLAQAARLEDILRLALARNPELSEATERARALAQLAPAASRLPDPELEYQLWAAPLGRPYALDAAEMHMFGLRQSFPAPGSSAAKSEAAAAQARGALSEGSARQLELRARVRRAFAAYGRAEREYRIHLEHVQLASGVLEIMRATYQGGRGTQQDVLRAMIELSRLHGDIASIERDRSLARALLNTLMARPLEAPLGPPVALELVQSAAELQQAEPALAERRPEISAAQSAIRASEAELEAARSASRWPSFMLGVQYMYMPPAADPHNYGVMFSMSLPWLSARYSEELSAARATVAARRSALSSTRLMARYQLHEATRRLAAARELLAILERDLIPQARSSFESAQAVYGGGQNDSLTLFEALRSWLDVRVERERARSDVEVAMADAELAAGAPLGHRTPAREAASLREHD
jgi:outer membrane protein, heavy metal efflux system